MKKVLCVALLSAFGFTVPHASGGSRVAIRVSPVVAFAPALLTVRTTIEPTDDNRRLTTEVAPPSHRATIMINLNGSKRQLCTSVALRTFHPVLYKVQPFL